jgi:predicted DNA-binding protein
VSEPLKSTHVRLSSEANRVLTALAQIEEQSDAEIARRILEEALLGRVHTLMLAAEKVRRLGFSGISGDLAGEAGKARK